MKEPEGPLTISPSPSNSIDLIHGEYVTEWIENPIWIPTQDQLQSFYVDTGTLQEELSGKCRTTHLIYAFYTFVFGEQFASAKDKAPVMEYSLKFKSMEQMWLGFIMQTEYGKRWNGEKWTTQKNI